MITTLWFQDRKVWRLILLRYLPFLAGLHLLWESAHVRLYTIWHEAELAYIAFSVLHCTLGDVLIGSAALFTALIWTRAGSLRHLRWVRIAAVTALIGLTPVAQWLVVPPTALYLASRLRCDGTR